MPPRRRQTRQTPKGDGDSSGGGQQPSPMRLRRSKQASSPNSSRKRIETSPKVRISLAPFHLPQPRRLRHPTPPAEPLQMKTPSPNTESRRRSSRFPQTADTGADGDDEGRKSRTRLRRRLDLSGAESESSFEAESTSSSEEISESAESTSTSSSDPNDDECFKCHDGGNLQCCDTCSRAFHNRCMQPSWRPKKTQVLWSCPVCSGFEGSRYTEKLRQSRSGVERFKPEEPTPSKPQHRRRRRRNQSSSSESSTDEDIVFERKIARSLAKARDRIRPVNTDPNETQVPLPSSADVQPMSVDLSIGWESVGGLDHHIGALKEMVLLPLLYPEVYQKFSIKPPRGVLFYGPPGTGKTLVARALAAQCSAQAGRQVSFFMRKGADCLSKWVGEAERQLRLLFEQANKLQPSIIFFDEVDGLAPVRSSRQDQIHSSIVSTLLALMDGLDDRGNIVVIGATNRIDTIDPALRRPGRFDREFSFPLPVCEARSQILSIHTRSWNPRPSPAFIQGLARKTAGFCGADLKALCTEAALVAVKRRYPQIYASNHRLQINVNEIKVVSSDFAQAARRVTPASDRATIVYARPLSDSLLPLLSLKLQGALVCLGGFVPFVKRRRLATVSSTSIEQQVALVEEEEQGALFRPRLLLCGTKGMGQNSIGPAVIHALEECPVYSLDMASLLADVNARSPEEALVRAFGEARRHTPSIAYLPHVDDWWNVSGESLHSLLPQLLSDVPAALSLLFLATSSCPADQLHEDCLALFPQKQQMHIQPPSKEERAGFFNALVVEASRPLVDLCEVRRVAKERLEEKLPILPLLEAVDSKEKKQKAEKEKAEHYLRELRILLRECLNQLRSDRRFKVFCQPVDPEDAPDYYQVITNPLDLTEMLAKVDSREYYTADEFVADLQLVVRNAIEYNPPSQTASANIRSRARELEDVAASCVRHFDRDVVQACERLVHLKPNDDDEVIQLRRGREDEEVLDSKKRRRQTIASPESGPDEVDEAVVVELMEDTPDAETLDTFGPGLDHVLREAVDKTAGASVDELEYLLAVMREVLLESRQKGEGADELALRLAQI